MGFLTGVKRFAVARIGTLSIDGTKVRANASKRKAMSYGRMVKEEQRLEAEIKALVGRAGAWTRKRTRVMEWTFGATRCRRS